MFAGWMMSRRETTVEVCNPTGRGELQEIRASVKTFTVASYRLRSRHTIVPRLSLACMVAVNGRESSLVLSIFINLIYVPLRGCEVRNNSLNTGRILV